MQVETRTSSCLHLKRAPGIRSWSLLVGKDFHITPKIKNLTSKKDENETRVFFLCFTAPKCSNCFISLHPPRSYPAFTDDASLFCVCSPLNILSLMICLLF